ncbi:MAG: DUF4062 domain-containing protein [Clostridiales bacterium]|nr:DUF4062 domain-containing protein [Clostridiales bacterium]
MKNVKYQVFISSTYSDLIEERRKALDILLSADCIPAGMEAFVATDNEQFEVIKKVIDLCDYYVLIIGKRYGSVSPDTGMSYTEMEYEYALSKNIPVLVFAIDESVILSEDKIESDPDNIVKLNHFRNKAMKNRLATVWKTDEELIGRLAVSIMKAVSEIKRPGWQRAVDYDEASLRREIMDLQTEKQKLLNEIQEKQTQIDSYSKSNDLAFEDYLVHFEYTYYDYGSNVKHYRKQDILLIDVFRVISVQMLNVMITEKSIVNAISTNIFKTNRTVHFDDPQIIKIILNQLTELGLIYSIWRDNKSDLFWGLTEKGIRKRNELVLVKNTPNSNKDDENNE